MINRGDIFDADLPEAGRHPVVVITRQSAIPVLSTVSVVMITSNKRGHVAEVGVGKESGLDHESFITCDNLYTVRKKKLLKFRGRLGTEQHYRLNAALTIALGLD